MANQHPTKHKTEQTEKRTLVAVHLKVKRRKGNPRKRLAGRTARRGPRAVWNLRNEGREWAAASNAPKRSRTKETEKCLDLVSRRTCVALVSDFWTGVRAGASEERR